MTIREIIQARQNEILNSKDLMPDRAAAILCEMAALLGNILDCIRERDIKYNQVLLQCYKQEEKANRARIRAECTSEYNLKREARDTRESAIELIRSIKFFLKSKEEERRYSGSQ